MDNELRFSILIPTWNNLSFLQTCVQAIHDHSARTHQILVHINEGNDGTLEWVKEQGLEYTYSRENIGICHAVNRVAPKAKNSYIVYLNDDMVPMKGWDRNLEREVNRLKTNRFMLSATMIEPLDTGNPVVVQGDYGRNPDQFRKEALLDDLDALTRNHWSGASWPPVMVHRSLWEEVGGFSPEFSPGMYSDPDLSMKLWQRGVRHFMGVGDSLVYHFQQTSTKRIEKNDGRRQFMKKWGISASFFYRSFLRMGKPYCGFLKEPSAWEVSFNRFITKLKLKLR